jgi:hypothetical protein
VCLQASSAYKHSLKEVLALPAIAGKIKDTKAAREVSALQDFYAMLTADSSRAFYGPGHVLAAAELGAIQTLLISGELPCCCTKCQVQACCKHCMFAIQAMADHTIECQVVTCALQPSLAAVLVVVRLRAWAANSNLHCLALSCCSCCDCCLVLLLVVCLCSLQTSCSASTT